MKLYTWFNEAPTSLATARRKELITRVTGESMSASARTNGRRRERPNSSAFGVPSCCTAMRRRREPRLSVCSARRRTRVGRATRIWPLLVWTTGFTMAASATAPAWEVSPASQPSPPLRLLQLQRSIVGHCFLPFASHEVSCE